MKKVKFEFIYIPHALLILFALFLLLFSVDVFGGVDPIWKQVVGFLIHSIPSMLLLVVFLLSRKWPLIGAITGFIVFAFFTFIFNTYREISSFLFISLPILIVSGLYLIAHYRNIENNKE